MRFLFLLFVTMSGLLGTCGVAAADDLTGQASIIDGDTIDIHGAWL
jgi:hypothetical protein